MLANGNVDTKWSEKKMEGDDGLRTVECLRGRLLAERVASRVAKDDAELMGNKLIELENQLRIETKSRNKAEKKLKILMKKLESMKNSFVSEESEQCSSSENNEISSRSSTTSSATKEPEVQEPISQITHYVKCKEDPSPQQSNELKSSRSAENSNTDDQSIQSSMEIDGENDRDREDYVDNSLALVPASLPAASRINEVHNVNGSVSEVLAALRHAKEKLQSSMETRHMIKVGSIKTQIYK